MSRGRLETAVETSQETISDGEAFFDVDIDTPTYTERCHWVSEYDSEDHTIYLNPLLLDYTEHESRHAVHHAVIQDVVERNEDDIKTYYENELDDLSDVPGGSGLMYAARKWSSLFFETENEKFYSTPLDELDSEELALRVRSKNRTTNQIQEEFYANNEAESELLLNTVVAPLGATVSGAGTADIYTTGIELLPQEPLAAVPPLTILASYRAVQQIYQGHSSEPLIDENLEAYDTDDRQRAMLYNSRVENTLDDFLSVLDSYNIG